MGIELELMVLLLLTTFGMITFGVFEVETARWRKFLKWTLIDGLTLGLYFVIGHWTLLVPAAGMLAGSTVHFVWCRRHDIHPWDATPRRRYYELRGWAFPE